MILQGQLGIRIKAEKGANADGLIAQVGEFGISVAIVIVARAIAVLSVDVESRFVVFRYQGGIQRRVVLERTASTNRHQRMGKLGGVTGGLLGNDIDGSPDGGCAEQIEHNINGGGLSYDYFSPDEKNHLNVYFSFQNTARKSYYGSTGEGITEEDKENAEKAYGTTSDLTLVGGALFRQATLHAV